ncbi:MAG: alpha/beta hydrolase [Myxococcales bacterium]|nr:alpha/beta hydrolase [Myxococcales bacterium]
MLTLSAPLPPGRTAAVTAARETLALLRTLIDSGKDLHPATHTLHDGTHVHVRQGGQGKRVALLLHGFCGDHRQLLGVARALQATHRVWLVDARGHGRSDRFIQRPTMARLADDFAELLALIGGAEVDAVGLSMGAQTLFEFVRRHGTQRLRRLVFIDQGPRLLPADGWPHALFGGMTQHEVDEFLADIEHRPRALGKAWLKGIWRTNEPLLHRLALTPVLLAGLPGVHPRTLQLAADMLAQDWREVVPRINRPVLLCYGGRSMYPGAGRWMHAHLPDSRLEWFADSGHGLTFSEPLRLQRAIAGFLGPA